MRKLKSLGPHRGHTLGDLLTPSPDFPLSVFIKDNDTAIGEDDLLCPDLESDLLVPWQQSEEPEGQL